MKPADIASIISVGQPALSPDATTVAFVVNRVDEADNAYGGQVWTAAVDGSSPPAPFTSGEFKDANPAWSPDGARMAFTSTRGEGEKRKATLHVAPVHTGGEVVTLASLAEAACEVRWSPDGRWIAFTSRTRGEGYDDDEAKHPPGRVTRLFSRLDSTGYTVDRPQHVYAVPADGSAPPRNLTPGEHQLGQPAWTAGSDGVVVSGATHDTWDLDRRSDLHVVDLASGEMRTVTGTTGDYASPSVSPDGTRVAFVGSDDAETFPRNGHIAVTGLSGGPHDWVSHGMDRTFAPFPFAQRPHWLDDVSLLTSMEDRGNTHLYRLSADGSRPPEPLWCGEGVVTGYDEAAGTIVFTKSTPTHPAELFVLDDGGERRITEVTSGFAVQARLRGYEHFTVPSTDGSVELDAWMLAPPDLDPAGSYPTLLNVHGGPFTQYANAFFDEVQLQARAGYVVIWCNPRGSSGREESFGRAIVGPPLGGTGWGSVDYDDVMAVVEHVVGAHDFVDGERLGILGGSYGGYMTSWVVGHTDRFRAACSERAANNLLTLEGASDAGGAFRGTFGAIHIDDPDLYLAMSPITHVRDIDTPLMLIHSDNDLRCQVEQADQMFVAMRLQGKDVELVKFPAESHELSRSGSPVHRRQRAEIILDFFAKHLRP